MSGYLEVKYPFKSNLGLNPFKTWKRQWCILRPSPTCAGGVSLAVYCSEAGASAGAVELPPDSVVRRAKSRSRPHAFAVFSVLEPHKPRILLAAQTFHDAQLWMDKIKALLDSRQLLGTELLKDSYSVTIITSELSRKLGLSGDGVLTLTTRGVLIARSQKLETLIKWKHIKDTSQSTDSDKNKICVVNIHSLHNGGCLKLSTPLAAEMAAALTQQLNARLKKCKRLSRSEGDLRTGSSDHLGETRRSSWSDSGPFDVALDDTDLLMLKESKRILSGQLSRCPGAGHLPSKPVNVPPPFPHPPHPLHPAHPARLVTSATMDDCMSDRRSLLSIASGIYEEIPDLPDHYTRMSRDVVDCPQASFQCGVSETEKRVSETEKRVSVRVEAALREEPTYESVAECVYATMRRSKRCPPPPLPPRLPFGTMKLGESWNSRMNASPSDAVTRHSSLGSLPRCHSVSSSSSTDSAKTKTLPKPSRQPFSVFRKRLKSESRIVSPKTETAKENKDVETKKKKFDFTPTRDIFKNFKVSRKMKNLKISPGCLSKVGETKSCEFLDETEHVTAARCSKSVECLEANDQFVDEFDGDLSLEFNDDAVTALGLPQEIVDLIIRSEHMNSIRLKAQLNESDYMPMSPIIPPAPVEHHYITMSPRTNLT